jgi:hypothetical protein
MPSDGKSLDFQQIFDKFQDIKNATISCFPAILDFDIISWHGICVSQMTTEVFRMSKSQSRPCFPLHD